MAELLRQAEARARQVADRERWCAEAVRVALAALAEGDWVWHGGRDQPSALCRVAKIRGDEVDLRVVHAYRIGTRLGRVWWPRGRPYRAAKASEIRPWGAGNPLYREFMDGLLPVELED